ncbi:MAG: response regulator [Flavobacteriales bacterium]|nr:response regulator [Flavobacteriales bacterium]
MEKIKVLYVDDEHDNLMAFNSSFRRVFDVYIADSAIKGIEILKTNGIEILIADQRMPEMTGVEFFESILDDYPNPIRILLTGYSDINAVKDAINKGQVYKYINKPWDEYELKVTIENAYLLYQLKEQNNKLKNKYQKVFAESNDAIMIFDQKGRLIDYNKASLELFSTTKPQLNLTLLTDLVSNKIEADYIFNTLLNNKKGIINYESKLAFNGIEKTCLISASKIADNYDDSFTFQAIIRDISENVALDQLIIKSTIAAQENERGRIARDLHDSVGQSLVGIKFQLEQLKPNASKNQIELIDDISNLLSSSIQQLRSICYGITPPVLTDFGIEKAINQLCINYSKNNLSINTEFNQKVHALDKDLEIGLYRIIQEFIQNSIKHANCKNINISFQISQNKLLLALNDDGVGFDVSNISNGLGIANIKSRVKSLKGNLNVQSKIGGGTKIEVDIPLK